MKAPVRTLRIDGCKTTLTPAPDDAELAAQALLESMASKPSKPSKPSEPSEPSKPSKPSKAQYYRKLSERIKACHEADRRAALRFVAYCEAVLEGKAALEAPEAPEGKIEKDGSAVANSTLYTLHSTLSALERGLYQHQDAAERNGGDLLKRWQHCLAEVIVRQTQTDTD